MIHGQTFSRLHPLRWAGGRIGIKYGEVMKSWQLWLNRFTLAIDSKASELDN
jgi:hypothetical protein